MACHHVPGGLQDLLNETWGKDQASRKAVAAAPLLAQSAPRRAGRRSEPALSPYQFSKKIEKAIDEYVRPHAATGRRRRGNRGHQGYAGLLPPGRRLPGLRRRRPDLADAGRADLKDMVDERIRVIDV